MTKLLQSWNDIQEREREIAHNSAVKIEATIGRDENVKVRKDSVHPTPSLYLDLLV